MRRQNKQPPVDTPAGARQRAVRALARREHSATELRRRLTARGVPEPLAEQAVRECAHRGWQSDQRYAEMLVRQRVTQGYGPLRIEAELQAAGVTEAQIRTALAAADGDWSTLCVQVWRRKFHAPAVGAAEWQKQYRFLSARGFTTDQVRAALKSAPIDD